LDTGEVEHPEHVVTWLGAIGYLAFLDQVGTALKRKRAGSQAKGSKSIQRCLRDFAPRGLTERDLQALYALRCSLAHDYSLFNPGGRRDLRFRFALHAERGARLLVHARRRWSGSFTASQPQSTETLVNLWALGDLAEACHQSVQDCWRAGRLTARVTPSELLVRYGFAFRQDSP
jgi:hypothetical protein